MTAGRLFGQAVVREDQPFARFVFDNHRPVHRADAVLRPGPGPDGAAPVTLADAAGLIGAALILLAFALVQARRLDPHKAAALLMNLLGAGLVMASLSRRFNLAAFLLEAAWALVALWGLARLAAGRLRRR